MLRLEKGHVIVGQDTDSESNLYSSGMSWLKLDKDDFVGKYALEHFARREEKERLVGFTMEDDYLPAEGAGRDRGAAGGSRDERAPQRGGGSGHRARLGSRRPRRERYARRDPHRPAAARAR